MRSLSFPSKHKRNIREQTVRVQPEDWAGGRVKFQMMGAYDRSFAITVNQEAESLRPEERTWRIVEGPLKGSMPVSKVLPHETPTPFNIAPQLG